MSVLAEQDANWDLLSYHLQNGAAWLHGRFGQDLLAAGMQSTLNPVLDAAYAVLALGPLRNSPRVLAAAMGLWFGAGLYLAFRLADLLYGSRRAAVLAAVLIAVTGTATLTQIGTTTGELQVGVIMLAGLFVLLRSAATPLPAWWSIVVAGVLFGVAAGLKLTAAAYAPAACLAAASLQRPGRMLAVGAGFAGGWLAGFAVSDGWWAWQLYERFASPTFPLFNGVFRSPWYPPATVVDDRFFPRGLAQWLFYPLTWTGNQSAGPSESPFRDLRGAVALCLGIASVMLWASRRPSGMRPFTPPQRATLVFLAAGYATWLTTSSILRYAVVIEVIAGLVIPLLLARVLPARAGQEGLAVVLALTLATTRYPPSARVPYGSVTLHADMDWVQPGMLIVLTFRGPSSHVLALMPQRESVSVLNVGNTVLEARGWPLHDEVVRRIRDHAGRIAVVTEGHIQGRFPELGEVGLSPDLVNCRPIGNTFVPVSPTGIHVCDGRRLDQPPMPSPFWAQAAVRYRTLVQPYDESQSLVGAAYLRAAGPAARGTKLIDWTDLLWSGVRGSRAPLPRVLASGTLYVVAPEHALAMAARIDPASDMLGWVDGLLVAAPGWRHCGACTAPIEPFDPRRAAHVISVGESRTLGADARASGYLLDGWWPQEASGIWSQEQAELILPLGADLPAQSTLVLAGQPFTGPGLASQRVVADIPGQTASAVTQTLTGDMAIRLPVQRAWLRPNPDGTFYVQVRLRFPDADSPARLGMSADTRRLGFRPAHIRLEGR